MVNYQCPRCGFKTKIKTKYTSHLSRKYICKNIICDDNLNNEYLKFNINKNKMSAKCQPQNNQMSAKCQPQYNQMSAKCQPNVSLKSNFLDDDDEYECKFCNNIYKHRQSLHKHFKKCIFKKEKEDMMKLVNKLNEQLEKKDKQIDELIKKTGVTNITNIQNNIKLLPYKNTDTSHLTDNDYYNCIKHSNFCIPHLIEKIHFNPEKPENHNIYISNFKNNYAMIYDGYKWTLRDRDDEIINLIDEKEYILEQKLEEWIENGEKYPDAMKKFDRYLEKKENDKVLNKVKNEIKLMLFNNRNIITKD